MDRCAWHGYCEGGPYHQTNASADTRTTTYWGWGAEAHSEHSLFALICRLAYRNIAAVDILAPGSLPALLRENVFVTVGAWRDDPYHD